MRRSETNEVRTELVLENRARVLSFLLASVIPAAFVWVSMRSLVAITLTSDTYSHIPLIPIVSFYLIYAERRRIFSRPSPGWQLGTCLLLGGIVCFVLGRLNLWAIAPENMLSIDAFGIVLAWAGAFEFFFGSNALRAASFPFFVSLIHGSCTSASAQSRDLPAARGQLGRRGTSLQRIRGAFSSAWIRFYAAGRDNSRG